VYDFDAEPRDSRFSGHVNGRIGSAFGMAASNMKLFPTDDAVFNVREDHFMAMGDNTMNSKDSREWGDFSRENVIGKYSFVYWPFTDRWGFGRK
jgi:signal peptidase I